MKKTLLYLLIPFLAMFSLANFMVTNYGLVHTFQIFSTSALSISMSWVFILPFFACLVDISLAVEWIANRREGKRGVSGWVLTVWLSTILLNTWLVGLAINVFAHPTLILLILYTLGYLIVRSVLFVFLPVTLSK